MNAFKTQQFRWAKGLVQTGMKLLPRILRSKLPLKIKIEAFFHLSANISYPLMIVLSLLMLPAMIVRFNAGWFQMLYIDLPLWLAATASVSTFYLVAQRELYADWRSRLKYLPFLMAVGIGLSVSNSKAVIEALLGIKTSFKRTPKYRIEKSPTSGLQRSISADGRVAAGRNCSGLVLCARGVLRDQQPELSDDSLPDAIRRRVHLHGPDVGAPREASPLAEGAVAGKRFGAGRVRGAKTLLFTPHPPPIY
jgi:hypothetical protein